MQRRLGAQFNMNMVTSCPVCYTYLLKMAEITSIFIQNANEPPALNASHLVS